MARATSRWFAQALRGLGWAGGLMLATACNAGTPAATHGAPARPEAAAHDAYDAARMDLAPRPSKTGTETPALPAANAGTAQLPSVPALSTSRTLDLRLDVTNVVVEVAPGVKYAAWTFGGSVPGPVARVRRGDLVKFTMTNRSAEKTAGVQVGVPMPHSMDFHAAMVSPQDKYHSIMPGETITFEFTANYPGIYMYHCGTPLILEHLVSGMYGMLIVEPDAGYPTKVDREYAIVQSEFYLKPSGKNDGLSVLDMDRARSKDATQVAFNGRALGMVEHPLKAKPGERVRLFVLNAGPSGTSSFHVVGTIFDRVWWEGNPDNQFRGSQTALLGASNSVIVEFLIPEKGKYIMVDHEFADATKGAIGLIDATDGASGAPAEGGASLTPVEKGKAIVASARCAPCHVPAQGTVRIGPDLGLVFNGPKPRTDAWVDRWLTDTAAMQATDDAAKSLVAEWNNVTMPPPGLTPDEVTQVKAFLKTLHPGDVLAPAAPAAPPAPASAPAEHDHAHMH
ncbi:MAG: hypothetical protein RLZZ324_1073 [Candidatus Parcubacteria bacterium]|jgi:nitrite reductase (NO-forming)